MTGHTSSDVTGEVARFVSETRFEDLDTTTVEQLKRLILDGVANAVGGLCTSASGSSASSSRTSAPGRSLAYSDRASAPPC